MNALKVRRGHAKGCVTRAVVFAENIDPTVTIEMLEVRLEKLEDAWSNFISLHNEFLNLSDATDFVDPEPEFIEYESKYFLAQSSIKKSDS